MASPPNGRNMADDLIQFDGGVLVADMVADATITDASELTQYAIEDGSLISDHVIRQPRKLSLTLVQTETPIVETTGFALALQTLGYEQRPAAQQTATLPVRQSEFRPAPLMALSGALRSLLFGGGPPKEVSVTGLDASRPLSRRELKVHVLSPGAPADRVNLFYANLLSLLETATPVIVTLKGASYIDLVVISVTRTDAAGQTGKASFGVELQQIATVETKTVDLPPVPKSKAPKQNGAKAAKETTEEQKKRLRGLLLNASIGAGFQDE
jgi:hypothetical protein